jgi:hypothetical protein
MGAQMPESLRAALHRPHPDEWQVPCPGCGAKAGTACRTPRGRAIAGGTHPSRADAWIRHQYAA